MKKEQKKTKEKEKRCLFDKDLKCEDCRLYQTYLGGGGHKACVFVRMEGLK